MPVADFIALILQVGEPIALELLKKLESGANITSADFIALKLKYGGSAAQIATATGLSAPPLTGS